MRRKILFLFVIALMLTIFSSSLYAEPKNWPAVWSSDIALKVNWNHPYQNGFHDTWETDVGYAIDFMPPDQTTPIAIYSPVDGTIICCNYPEYDNELLSPLNKNSCPRGHANNFDSAYGYHMVIRPDEDSLTESYGKYPYKDTVGARGDKGTLLYTKNTFIIAHLSAEGHPPLSSFTKIRDGVYKVAQGDFLGYMGDTGEGGKHLHFELINRYRYSQNASDCDDVQLFGLSKTNMTSGYSLYGKFTNEPPVITPPVINLKNNYVYHWLKDKQLNYTFKLKEGTEPVTWSITGTLPSGIEFTKGVLSGKTSQKGKYKITVKASNSADSDSKTFTLDIYDNDDLPYITTASLSAATLNKKYSGAVIEATGRTPITLTAQNLPSGLSFSSDGKLTGKPSQPGTFSIKFSAKNELGTHEKTLKITVREKPVIITGSTLPEGYTYTAYEKFTLEAEGTPAPTWSLAALSSLPSGLSLSSKGVISGTPTKAGTYKFSVTAKNSAGSSTKEFTIVIKTGDPHITTSSLPSAKVGAAYKVQLKGNNISGGAWAAYSTLPAGLTLSKDGILSGTPYRTGEHWIYARAINKTGGWVDKSFKLTITGAITIKTAKLSNATVGKKYSATLTATASTSVTWATYSQLPAGLTLSKDGILSGTPIHEGEYWIYVRAIDAYGNYQEKTLILKVINNLAITTEALTDATVGEKYKFTFTSTGKTTRKWCATSTLPQGLTLSSKGVLSGTPVHAGEYWIYVKAIDTYGSYVDKTLKLKIIDSFAITTKSLKDATVGKSYKVQLKATGATEITWCAYSELPPGLTLSKEGILSGTPAYIGEFYVYARAINSYGSYINKSLKLKVGGSENNSAIWLSNGKVGENYSAEFSIPFQNYSKGKITCLLSSKLPKGLSFKTYESWIKITGKPEEAGHFRIKATLKDKGGNSAVQWLSLTVYNDLKITTKSLKGATVGKSYKATLKATGADALTFVFDDDGDWPAGVTLSPSGAISGTPLYPGEYDFYFHAYDIYGHYAEKYLTIKVADNSPVIITSENLPDAKIGTVYSAKIEATGSSALTFFHYYYWYDGLPEGLTLSQSGVISGTPLYSGKYDFYVVVYDIYGNAAGKNFTLKVADNSPVIITSKSLPNAKVGTAYSTQIKATGPGALTFFHNYYWYGDLPEGLTLSPSGVISGTPLYSGKYDFYVHVYDIYGHYAEKSFTINVKDSALSITTKSLADATVGKSYKATLKATGPSALTFFHYYWYDGLPEGLTLSPSGVISGTPLYSGKYDFYVMVYDIYGNYAEKNFTINVNEAANKSTETSSAPYETKNAKENTDENSSGETHETQAENLITFGKNRDKNSLSEEILRGFANEGYVIAAVLPEISVTKDDIYDFAVSIDKNVQAGSKLLWRSMPQDNADISDDDEGAVFTDESGGEITAVPENYHVKVSAWLREKINYAPVIAAKINQASNSNEELKAEISNSNTEENLQNSSGGGCNNGIAGAVSLMLVMFFFKKKY